MADPTAASEQRNPTVNLSPEEKKLYTQIFQAADKEGLGVVTGDVALSFFPQRTKLPVDVLGEIWQLADVEDKGFLTPNGFYVVLRLIGYAQAGRPVNAQAATQPGPLPRFDGVKSAAPAAAPLQPQGSGGPIRVPPLQPDKAARYAALFEESGAQNGLLAGTTAKSIFDRAELPNEVLVRIWNLADTEMRGMLSATEFIIAMHLLASFRDGSMRALPQTLPAGLYEAAARRGVPPPRQAPGHRQGPTSPTAVPRQLTGGPGRTSSPLAQQSYTAPALPLQGTGQSQATAAEGWAVKAADKAKYDRQFAGLDTSGSGFVSGNEAVPFFSNSGLSEDELAQIWDLSDINKEGRLSRDEFAVAMHLILQAVQTKGPVPAVLPANLVPPSMRHVVANPQKSTAPDFQPQAPLASKQAQSAAEDLFGLDALEGPVPPAAPAAIPQVAQSTGGSSSFATPSSPRAPGSPAQLPKQGPTSTMFKPFQPSSTFGQSMVPHQQTGSGSRSPAVPSNGDDLLGDNDEASRNINNDSVEVGNLANQASTVTSQTQDLKNKRAATEQAVSQMSSQKRDLESRLAQMRQAYEQEAREVRALEERSTSLRTENTKLQQDVAMVAHTQQSLATEHQKVTEQLSADQQENARLKEQISQLNAEVAQLKPQAEKAKSDARHQKGLVSINKKQLANVEAERDRLRGEIDLAAKEHAEATQELGDIQTKTEALTQERENHNRELQAARERAATASKQREEAQSAFETTQQAAVVSPAAAVVSPAASVNSMNPFFNRSTTQASLDKSIHGASPAADTARPPNHSAFDDFFGTRGANVVATPPPPAAFGAFSPPSESSAASNAEAKGAKAESTPSSETRSRIPPSPPRSRQITSSALPLRKETTQAPSDTSSVGVAAPASRFEGSSGVATPVERQSVTPEVSKLGQHVGASDENAPIATESAKVTRPGLTSVKSDQANELPGAFPDETPFQTPTGTGSTNGAGFTALAPQGTGNDPFASKPRTPTSTREDSDSVFASYGTGKGKEPERAAVDDFPAPPSRSAAGASEFPPIQHFDNDETDSDSDSDAAFEDSFASSSQAKLGAAARPTLERGPSTTAALPAADAQASPPNYERTADSEHLGHGRDSNQFPAEYTGLLPSRENPTSPVQSPQSIPHESAISPESSAPFESAITDSQSHPRAGSIEHGGSAVPLPMPAGQSNAAPFAHSNQTPSTALSSGFDAFDNDFNDLSEAQAEETGTAEDLTASIASRRDTLDEFNPTFDSPAPSTRATGTFSDPHASVGGSAFADFESSFHSAGPGAASGTTFGTGSQLNSSHDWDAMFAGVSTGQGQSNGASAIDEAFGEGPGNLASSLSAPAPTKPALARAISTGTEHDDPILKRLTGMGFKRDDSLKALEKFDYNIDKAADFLTTQTS